MVERKGFELSVVLTEYERNIVRDLLDEAVNSSQNAAAKLALQKMMKAVDSTALTNLTIVSSPGHKTLEVTVPAGTWPDTDEPLSMTPADAPEIGDVMPAGHPNAGWIYMGPDHETGEEFYAAPQDESGTFTFNQAARRAEIIGAQVPTKSQLDKMYRSRDMGALKGTFNVTGSYPAGWYWSSTEGGSLRAWGQRFSDGNQYKFYTDHDASSLRCVRPGS